LSFAEKSMTFFIGPRSAPINALARQTKSEMLMGQTVPGVYSEKNQNGGRPGTACDTMYEGKEEKGEKQ
jgi:hypothetical protein